MQEPYRREMKPANGVLILVLGILSLVMCGLIAGIPAWIMGNNSLKDIDAGYADPNERGMVQAGRICGIISVALSVVGILIWMLIFVVFGAAAITGTQTR